MSGFVFNIDMMTQMGNSRDLIPMKIKEKMAEDPQIMYFVSDAATKGSHVAEMVEKYPDRCIDVGIAEPDLVGAAAGAALSGKKCFGQAFGPFLSVRATDQILLDVAYNKAPVCLIGTHGGLTSGGGPTHYTIMDSTIIRAIPGMTMVVPSDANQCLKVLEDFIANPRPIYVRIARGEEPLVYESQEYDFKIGKAIVAREGSDITLIGDGIGVYNALQAAELLEREGISARVLDMHTVKPMDADAVLQAAKETGGIITVEDHSIIGGLGGGVAEILAESGIPAKLKRLGVPDVFAKLGYPEQLYPLYGYDAQGIVKAAKSIL